MTSTEVERELGVDIAMHWGTGYDTTVRSFVNIIATPKGGTHVAGFERALTKALNEALRAARLLKTGDDDVVKDDVSGGPHRGGHRPAGRTAVRGADQGGARHLGGLAHRGGRGAPRSSGAFLTSTRRVDKAMARTILEKVVAASRTRIAARQHKELQRRKNALESSSLPTKLVDCRTDDIERTRTLHRRGRLRSRHRQAGAVERVPGAAADPRQDPERPEGVRGRHAQEQRVRRDHPGDRRRLGSHLRSRPGALRQDRPDVRRRRRRRPHPLPAADPVPPVHASAARTMAACTRAVPPLHRIEVIVRRLEEERVPLHLLRRRDARGRGRARPARASATRTPIQRYKGLGEMDAAQLRETTMDPRRRTLRRVTIGEVEPAPRRSFELLMGSEVAPRHDFIVDGANQLRPRPHRRLTAATTTSRSVVPCHRADRAASSPRLALFLHVDLQRHADVGGLRLVAMPSSAGSCCRGPPSSRRWRTSPCSASAVLRVGCLDRRSASSGHRHLLLAQGRDGHAGCR